jgi:F0F1-type ATP synthase delta subunit
MSSSRARLATLVADRTLKKGQVERGFARKIAAYLMDTKHTGELESLIRDVQAKWAEAGYLNVVSESAHPLTAQNRSDIARVVKRYYPAVKKVNVSETLEADQVGGVRLNMPEQQLDLSLEGKLNQFKQSVNSSGKD